MIEADQRRPRRRPRGSRGACPGPIDQVVADERPVDVEGDQADGQDGFGRHDAGHRTMMPDGRSRRWRRGFGAAAAAPDLSSRRGSPGDARQAGQVRLDRAGPARQPLGDAARRSPAPWSAPISSSATPPPASASGSRSSSRPMTASPSGPPSSASARLERRRAAAASAIASVRTYGRLASTRSKRSPAGPSGSRSASANDDPVGDRVADRVLARELERVRRRCRRRGSRPPRAPGACGARRPARPRSRRSRSRRRRPGAARRSSRAGQAPSRRMTSACGELDEALGLGPRDQRPRDPPRRRARRTP